MRQIKFRIWDKSINGWVHDTKHAVNLFGEYIIMGEILRRPDDSTVPLQDLNELVPMQFTGLIDKNGVDIFEGDIIDRDGMGCFAITIDEYHGHRYMMGLDQLCKADAVYGYVVGNIYENPDIEHR